MLNMKIQVLSDLHLEFHLDKGRSFIDMLNSSGVDVLIVAGDLTLCKYLLNALTHLSSRYPHVIFVPGNHEYYGCVHGIVNHPRKELPRNCHWLDRDSVTISEQRFIGTTLWFADTNQEYRQYLNDFYQIRNFVPAVFEENRLNIEFLKQTMKSSDIVITHHLPSKKSTHPQYQDNPLNAFFVCDIEPLIVNRQPKLFVHGHTHDSCDYNIGKTRVVCNPYGYELQEQFNPKLIIEI